MNLSRLMTILAGGGAAIALLVAAGPARAAPTAAFDWSMDRKVGHGNDRVWGLGSKTGSFPVNLDACASRPGGSPIVSYRWQMSVGGKIEHRRSASCRLTAPPPAQLPAQCARPGYEDSAACNPDGPFPGDPRFRVLEGRYFVTLEVTDQAGRSTRTSKWVSIRNTVVVALGDSFFSGEGNPDRRGSFGPLGYSGVRWLNRQCHRSAKSAPVYVAKELERSDPRSSVTFANLACSGATIDSGLLGTYDGITGGKDLPAQVDELRSLLCRAGPVLCRGSDMQTVDHLVISVGINDVGFSKILLSCMRSGDHCRSSAQRHFRRGYVRLSGGYRRLAAALGELPISRISIVEYPGDPIQERKRGNGRFVARGGCGAMRNITGGEADWLARLGRTLRSRMRRSARRYGWGFVGGTTRAFRGHGYCNNDEWYRTLKQSYAQQGDKNGTMHPDGNGHEAVARLLLDAMRRPGPTPTPPLGPGTHPGGVKQPPHQVGR